MKFTNKFEEMIDARINAIENLKKVTAEQVELLNYLTETKESSEKFKILVDSLKNEIEKHEKDIDILTKANVFTISLIKRLKKMDDKTSKLVRDVIEELGIFKEQENQAPKKK